MSDMRSSILGKLEDRRDKSSEVPVYQPQYGWSKEQKIERLITSMRAVRSEVVRLEDGNWMDWLNRELPERGLKRILAGDNETGRNFRDNANSELQVGIYEDMVEECKPMLFQDVDVGITTTRGGIAETGSLIVWPDSAEPRLLSLAPPVHVALLDSDAIFTTFADAMQQQDWASAMPTNALLISGPSKTADIEQTLAYGIHGPRQLIVLILG